MKIGIIGAGNMGYPMLCGAIKVTGGENVLFTCMSESDKERGKAAGAVYCDSNAELAAQADMVVLVIKPYVYDTVLSEIKGKVKDGAIVVTVAAGITISYIKEALGGQIKVVRVMPNTPAMVGEGMSAVTFDEKSVFTEEEKSFVGEFLTLSVAMLFFRNLYRMRQFRHPAVLPPLYMCSLKQWQMLRFVAAFRETQPIR